MRLRVIGALLTSALAISANQLLAQAQPPAESDGPPSAPLPAGMTRIFDGKTLDGWIQEPINATSFGAGDITDWNAFSKKLAEQSDPVSAFLSDHLDDEAKTALTKGPPADDPKALKAYKSLIAQNLTRIGAGPSLYNEAQFKEVHLRAETAELLKKNPQGRELARLNRVLLEDAYPAEMLNSLPAAWAVKSGALASLGAGRGVIYTAKSYERYRIIFDMRHVSGQPDHQACVLVFCTAPTPGEKPLDALGGIQFQVPNGGHWDYRKGHNNGGKEEFTSPEHPKVDVHQWSRCEILVDPSTGTARMAVAQPPDSKAVEVLDFKDPPAGRKGPFALQMHNKGLFDEYANIAIEENPTTDELITTK
jgi:hypothetical protein